MKFLSLLLSFIMTFTALPLQSLMNRGQDTQTNTEAVIENDDVTLEGGGGIGGLLTESIQQSQQNEAAKDEEENVSIENKILDVVITDNIATVSFNNDKICKIIVAVFDEEGKEMLAHGMVENIEEYAETAYVTIDNGTIPQYYLLRAFLLDENNVALHKSFESNYYTKAFQEFLAKTTDDFEGDEILSLDDDKTNNFGVFNEGVIKVTAGTDTNVLVSEDHDTKTYVFENCDETMISLAKGNILYFVAIESNYIIVKISDITVDGTTVTIVGGDVALDEVFKYLKIDTSTVSSQETEAQTESEIPTVQGAVDENGLATHSIEAYKQKGPIYDGDDSNTKTFNKKIEKTFESEKLGASVTITGDLDLTVGIHFRAYLDSVLFFGYADVTFKLDQTATATLTIEGKIERKEFNVATFSVGLSAIDIYVGIDVNLVFEAEATLTLTVSESSCIGFSYVTDEGFENLTEAPKMRNPEPNFDGRAYIGIQLKPTLKVLDIIEIWLSCELGLEVRVSNKKIKDTDEPKHLCDICLEGKVFCVPKISAGYMFDVGFEKIEDEKTLYTTDIKLLDFYISSELGLGFGVCPNDEQRAKITVIDFETREPLPEVVISIHNLKGTEEYETDSNGDIEFYTLEGVHTITLSKDGYETKTDIFNLTGKYSDVYFLSAADFASDNKNSEIIGKNEKTVKSGTLGSNLSWVLYDSGTFIIAGKGNMKSYSSKDYENYPWHTIRDDIKKVIIDNQITSIGNAAFLSCVNLTSVDIGFGVKSIGESAFENSGLIFVHIPDNVTSVGEYAFAYSELKDVSIGKGITNLSVGMFEMDQNLIGITIPDNITRIDEYALTGCESLVRVIIPDSVTSIGEGAFMWCSSLDFIMIPDSVTSMGGFMFDDCDSLTSVTIPDSVTSIGIFAFASCDSLRSVIIPDSVTSIGDCAFDGCSSLTDVCYDGSQAQWNKISIGSNNDPLLNATKHFNYVGYTVHASSNVKTLAVREYEAPKMLAESAVIAEPAANTVTKDDLVAGAVYTLIIIKGTQYDYELTNDSLLYITDAIADENGVATFTHYYNETGFSWIAVVYGECNHHASDWTTVTEPTFTEKGLKAQYCTKCSETLANEEIDIIPEKMVIESLPEKLTYSYGDTLDLTGLAVEYTYTDGRENVSLSESDYTVYGFDAQTFGVQTILIESGIYKARFDITVDLTAIPDGFTDKIDAGTTVESLAELYPNATVYALTADGKKTADGDELLKTGMILQIVQPDGMVNSVTVIVKGDATGDGIVNGKDIIRVKKQIAQGNAVEHIEYADINSDGVVNEDDITVLMSF